MKLATILIVGVLALAQQRFDMLVRDDFFAGLSGDRERFERAMTRIEEVLAKEPKHAEAKVWHGAGVLYRSSELFQKGDAQKGVELWQKGLAEMEEAVRWAPNNVGVLIPRGATLISTSRFTPPEVGKPILETGVGDYEKTLKIQEPGFAKMSTHSRGELLMGLADGWNRLGNTEKARHYFERMKNELPGSVYAEKAAAWLEGKPASKSPEFFNCSGCHVK